MTDDKTPAPEARPDLGVPPADAGPVLPVSAERSMDAQTMKAFAHPLRMAMYDYLNDRGSATATMLARHTGESTGQTSYHLRQLERHGFVEEDSGRGTGRERWWRAVGFSMQGDELSKDSATRPSVLATLQHQTAQRARALADWFGRAEAEPEVWRRASMTNRTTMTLTAGEAAELSEALMLLLAEHAERAKDRHDDEDDRAGTGDPDDTRRVRLYLDIFPLPRD